MPFYKLNRNDTFESGKPLFDDAERKRKQHQIANYVKQYLKETLDKGPEGMRVTIADDMIIIKIERYLTKIEKYIIENDPSGANTVRSMRIDAVTGILQNDQPVSFLEMIVDAKAVYSIYDSYPKDECCIWLFIFDRKLA